jgi:hypothetical protein
MATGRIGWLAAILCLVFSSPAYCEDFTVANDSGGNVVEYAFRAKRLARTGVRVRFAGRCDSACTLYLSIPNSCIEKGAYFRFHEPSNKVAIPYMMEIYPPWVRDWLKANGGLGKRMLTMSYEIASRALLRCEDAERVES